MGRKRNLYTDKFKLDVVREALRASEKQAEIAVKHDISPGTLSEWIQLFIDGKLETEEVRQLKEKNARLEEEKDMARNHLRRMEFRHSSTMKEFIRGWITKLLTKYTGKEVFLLQSSKRWLHKIRYFSDKMSGQRAWLNSPNFGF